MVWNATAAKTMAANRTEASSAPRDSVGVTPGKLRILDNAPPAVKPADNVSKAMVSQRASNESAPLTRTAADRPGSIRTTFHGIPDEGPLGPKLAREHDGEAAHHTKIAREFRKVGDEQMAGLHDRVAAVHRSASEATRNQAGNDYHAALEHAGHGRQLENHREAQEFVAEHRRALIRNLTQRMQNHVERAQQHNRSAEAAVRRRDGATAVAYKRRADAHIERIQQLKEHARKVAIGKANDARVP